MTLRELIKLTYIERNQKVEVYDYYKDEKGGYDLMTPPMNYGQFTPEEAHEVEYNATWSDIKNKNVAYFSFKDNVIYYAIDYDNRGAKEC